MPSTTNFGWTTPADSDYVKDGASAIRTLAGGIDTSMAQLKGGTAGQILSKTNGTDMAFTWINNDQGDITAVVAGTGLTGGATSGSATLSIDTATTVDKTTAQTLTNKTLTSPIISSISNTGTLTLPTSTDTLVGRATTDTLTNKTISASSNTLTGVINNTLTTTTGDLIYASSANTPARLAIGSSNQVLTVSGGVPTWANAASGGGMTLIQETALSGNSSLSFSSISGSYKQLLLVWHGVYFSGNGVFAIRLNNDSNSNYTTNAIYYSNTSGGVDARTAAYIQPSIDGFGQSITNTTDYNLGRGWLLIDNYASSTKYKGLEGKNWFYDGQYSEKKMATYVGTYASTTAITSIDIVRYSGSQTMTNAANTSVRLYGVS